MYLFFFQHSCFLPSFAACHLCQLLASFTEHFYHKVVKTSHLSVPVDHKQRWTTAVSVQTIADRAYRRCEAPAASAPYFSKTIRVTLCSDAAVVKQLLHIENVHLHRSLLIFSL